MITKTLKQNISNIISSSDNSIIINSLDTLFNLYLEQLKIITNNNHETFIGQTDSIHQEHLNCFKDYWRTSKFIKGTYRVIVKLLERFPNEEINLIDAECGSIAPLVLPICLLFPEAKLKVTLLDHNKTSLENVLRLYNQFNMSNYIGDAIHCNATQVTLPANKKYHMVSIKSIMPNLIREAQVAKTFNLGKQLTDGGMFIPEKIDVNALFVNLSEEIPYIEHNYPNIASKGNIDHAKLQEFRNDLNTIFRLDLNLVKGFREANPNIKFPTVINTGQVIFPKKLPPKNFNFVLEMKIKVFDDVEITSYESGLTHPMFFTVNEPFGSLKGLQFVYNVLDPGFSYKPIMKKIFA